MKSGDQVVMLLSLLIIKKGFFAGALFQNFPGYYSGSIRFDLSVQDHHFQCIQSSPPIAVSKPGYHLYHVFFYFNLLITESVSGFQGMMQQLNDLFHGKSLQHKNLAAGKKSGINFKGWIFRSRSDEDNTSFFHKGQKCILLGLIKTMDFIYKYNRLFSHMPGALGLVHHFLNFTDPTGNRTEINEFSLCAPGYYPGKSSLSHAGRSPEDHGRNHILINQAAENLPFPHQIFLTHEFLQS